MKYCVYTYSDPAGVVFYVGKGSLSTGRHRQHLYRATNPAMKRKLAKLAVDGVVPVINIVQKFLNEADAFACEMALIAQYGRRAVGGTLLNLTDGGEGASGARRSEAERARLRRQWSSVGPKVNAARDASWADNTKRAARVENLRTALSNPDVKSRQSRNISAALADDRIRRRISRSLKATLADPAQKAARSAISRARWGNGEFKVRTAAKIAAAHNKWIIVADGVQYGSAQAAADAIGVTRDCVTLRCRKGIYERVLK